MSESFVYSNVSLDKKKAYLLYVGGLKYPKICDFLIKPLKKHYGKDVDIIYVFPNFPSPHFKDRYVVLNNHLKKVKARKKRDCYVKISSDNFNRLASNSAYVKRLISRIRKNQKDLFIQLYKDSPEFKLHKSFDNVKLLGPKIRIFAKYDSKLFQHELADLLKIPQPNWLLVHGKKDLIKVYSRHWRGKKVFVSKLHSAGGHGCAVVDSKKAILNHPNINKERCKYILADFIDFVDSPTSSAIVANGNEVFFNGVMDQILEGVGNLGTIYPSKLDKKKQKLIEEYTVKIGKYLGKKGLRGFISLDFVVDHRGKVYFSEINPRLGGSTAEKVFMHEMTKKKGFPSLPELELRAVTKNTFGNIKPRRMNKANFSWGVFTVKIGKGSITMKDISPEYSEMDAFKKFKTIVPDFPGKNVLFCTDNNFVCRIISVKPTRKQVEKELRKKSEFVLGCIKTIK